MFMLIVIIDSIHYYQYVSSVVRLIVIIKSNFSCMVMLFWRSVCLPITNPPKNLILRSKQPKYMSVTCCNSKKHDWSPRLSIEPPP